MARAGCQVCAMPPLSCRPASTAAHVCSSCSDAQISKSSRASYLNVKSCKQTLSQFEMVQAHFRLLHVTDA